MSQADPATGLSVAAAPQPVSAAMRWTGRVISALPVLVLIMSGVMKIVQPGTFIDDWVKSGYSPESATIICVVEIACTILYVVPQTQILGAILVTGYLGGATATHVRQADGNWFFPVIFGVLVWLGIFLRDRRLRALMNLGG